MGVIPISKDIIEPIIKTNVSYVENIEEFENIKLQPNQTLLCFDNNQPCFYVRECNRYGEYSVIQVYFYQNFAQRIKSIEKEEFERNCKEAGLDDLKTQIACMFFLENKKPQEVWLWVVGNKIKDWSWDYVTALKCSLKKKLFKKITKT